MNAGNPEFGREVTKVIGHWKGKVSTTLSSTPSSYLQGKYGWYLFIP